MWKQNLSNLISMFDHLTLFQLPWDLEKIGVLFPSMPMSLTENHFVTVFFYGSDSGQKVILFNSKHILIEDRLIFLKSWFKAVIVLSWILSCSAKNSNKAITRRFCSFDVSSRAIESWYRIFLPSSFTWSWPTQGVHEAFMFAALQKAKSEFQELVQWASVFILFLKK